MIIENPDAFKTWLTSILEPLCDADPAALAKYVYALVKKDKALDELRDGMLDQLDVFLQQETKPFVDMLFKALETHEYLKLGATVENKQPSPPPDPNEAKEVSAEVEKNGVLEEISIRDKLDSLAPPPERPPLRERLEPVGGTHRVVVPRSRPLPPPHHEHTLVKVMPTELLEEPVDPPRRRDRRVESLRDREERRRRRSRSWERRGRRRPRDEHERRGPLNRRPASRSPSPRGRYRNRSPPSAAMERHNSRSRSRSPAGGRDRDAVVVVRTREMERERMSRDREHRDRVSRSRDRERSRDRSRDRSMSPHDTRVDINDAYKRRCRDFDVKGYCMRGDLCEWDHGVDPVVLEDATLTRVLAIPPPVPEYNPAAPDIWSGGVGGFGAHAPPPPHAHIAPRELVPIPRVRQDLPPAGAAMPPPAPRHPPPVKKNFDFNRLYQAPRMGGPPRAGGPRPPLPAHAANCSLEVKKVPRGLNDITHLNNHFSKFGKIVNIQVSFEGDAEAALITFSNPAEANVAYKSTEAVLNNRFIKVFWHNPENKQENTAPPGQTAPQSKPATERSNTQPAHATHNKVLINRDNIKATADNKQQLVEKPKETNGVEMKVELSARDKTKQASEMQKRAQELLQSQLQQQRQLIQRLETGKVTEQQKSEILKAINESQEGVEKLQKELAVYNSTVKQMRDESVSRSMSRLQLSQTAMKPKTPQDAQKEILDAELDIITKQQEGLDVTEQIRKIAVLRKQMAVQFPSLSMPRRPHSRGGRFNPAMRYTRGPVAPKYSVNQTIDHRPKALLISGFEPEEVDAVQAHFAQYGEITGKEVNMSVPELRLQFLARAQAEQAMLRARHYNDRTLSITWVTSNKPFANNVPPPAQNGDSAPNEAKEAEMPDMSEDSLLRFDEEDEEEEDRSWRR